MNIYNRFDKPVVMSLFAAAIIFISFCKNVVADDEPTMAFPDTWMIRAGAYVVDSADTTVSIGSPLTLGTIIDFQRDLGGEDGDSIPRVDAYYRFNDRHRIDFTAFSIDRKGEVTLAIDLTIGEENFFASETMFSDIKYTLYRLGYGYSFYHSPKTELTFSVGLNITEYDLSFALDDGTKAESAGLTVPLPTIGLRMAYAITPRWYVRYVSEAFFIDIDDTFRGAILNFEVNTEYRIFKNFALGVGLARIGVNADVNDDNWSGSVSDSYAGYNIFGTLYF